MRKIKALKKILDNLDINYDLKPRPSNTLIHEFYIRVTEDFLKGYVVNKNLTYKFLDLNTECREFVLAEIHNWDGLYERKSNYGSVNEINTDVLQSLMAITNIRGKKRIYDWNHKRNENQSVSYQLDITQRNYTGTANSVLVNKGVNPVWCVEVDNSYILVRRAGTTFITGNCQQIPNGVYRDAFKVKDEKNTLMFADFSNQEVRTVACLAEEEIMLDFFINGHPIYGDDMHTYTANNMNKAHDPNAEDFPSSKDKENFTAFHKKKRGEAKIISFGLLYGKEAKGFAADFGLSEDEAQKFIDNYFSAYPRLKESMDKWAKHTFKNKYIQIDTVVDRRWFHDDFQVMEDTNAEVREFYPEGYFERGKMNSAEKALIKEQLNNEFPEIKQLWRKYFGIQGSIQRKSTNYRIQGTSASETKTALIMMRNELIESGIEGIEIIIAVHDEIGIEVYDESLNNFAKEFIERNMMDGANYFLNPKIMTATAEVGKVWIH